MASPHISLPKLDLLLCGNGINFRQGDLALSTMILIRSLGADGREIRTVIDTGHMGMRRNILEALAKHGLAAEEVDFVYLTHVHWDHVQNVDLFSNARVVMSRIEWTSIQGEKARDLMTPPWTRHLIPDERLILVEPGDSIVAGIEFIAAPGHTAGCLAFGVELSDGPAIVTGDAIPWAEVARLERSALVFWDIEDSRRSIAKLVKRGAVMYPGHDRPFRLVDGKVEYLADYDITMFGADPSTPGLKFGPRPILATLDLTDGEPVGPLWTRDELRMPAGDS